jgi:ATP-binding cassette subfamily B protein
MPITYEVVNAMHATTQPSSRPSPPYLRLLRNYLLPRWQPTVLLAVLLFGGIGLQIVSPQFLRRFIDLAGASAPREALVQAALWFMALGLGHRGLSIAATYLSQDLGWRATNDLRSDAAAHVLGLDMSYHKRQTPGKLIERIDGDVLTLSNFFSQLILQVLGAGILLLGILVALFLEDWRVGLGLTLFAVLSMTVLIRLRSYALAESEAERESSANLFGFIEERLACRDDIRANGGGAYTMHRFLGEQREYCLRSLRAWVRRSTMWISSMGLFNLGHAAALALGAGLYLGGQATLGQVYLISHYTMMLFTPLERITHQLQDLQKAGAGATRVTQLLAERSQIPDDGREPLPDGPLAVTFDRVSFQYDDGDEQVVHDLSFDLPAGATLGLLGRTGCGKTTLTRLLFRLYDVTAGSIRLGPLEIDQTPLAQLRQRVGLVTQDVQLFQGTVRDNLTLFDPSISDERLLDLVEELGLNRWLESLPHGLDTELSAGGGGLSAGEGQLLALGRVFLQDPGLVILDEPSSRLDPATEHRLEQAINRLLADRTAIIIAHRLGTVQRVDQILIMEAGRCVEWGPRADLVADPHSRFSELLRTGMEASLVQQETRS